MVAIKDLWSVVVVIPIRSLEILQQRRDLCFATRVQMSKPESGERGGGDFAKDE